MTHPLVFTANDVNLDLSGLEEWGEITPVFKNHIYPDTTDEMDNYTGHAQQRMLGFDPRRDMIAMVGDPVLTSLMVACVVSNRVTRFTLLKFDRKLKAYYPATIDIGKKENADGNRTITPGSKYTPSRVRQNNYPTGQA